MKKLIGLMTILCTLVALAAVSLSVAAEPVMPADPTMPTNRITLDLSTLTTEVNTADYMVKGTGIWLYRRDVTYVLTGSTTKTLYFSNNPEAYASKTFSIVMSNATIGAVQQGNNKSWQVDWKLADGTTNTVGNMVLSDLHIFGTGTLNATMVAPVQDISSKLTITNATVKMTPATYVNWSGTVLLNGTANVSITGNDRVTPLQIGHGGKSTLTMANTAKLTVDHKTPDEASTSSVDGIDGFNGAEIKLMDNSRLDVTGKKCSGQYLGCGILLYWTDNTTGGAIGSFIMQDNATCNVTAYGDSGLCAADVSIHGGNLNVSNTLGSAVYGINQLSIRNATVVTNSNSKYYGLVAGTKDNVTIEKSWIVTNAMPRVSEDNLTESVIFGLNGDETQGTVYGNAVLPGSVTIPEGTTLEVPSGTTLTVPKDVTLTNNGDVEIDEDNAIVNNGTIVDNNCRKIWKEDDTQYWWYCRLCGHTSSKATIPTATFTGDGKTCWDADHAFQFTLPQGAALKSVQVSVGKNVTTLGIEDVTEEGTAWNVTVPHALYKEFTDLNLISVRVQFELDSGYQGKSDYEITLEHCGGTATCKDKATCEKCKQPYGELDANNHTNLKYFPAKEATATSEGNTAYWYCDGCGKYYSDKEGKNEIKQADTVIAKLTTSPATGDHSPVWLWFVLLLASGVALAGVIACGSKKKYSAR